MPIALRVIARNASDCTHRYNPDDPAPEEIDIHTRRARAAGLLFGFAASQYVLLEGVVAAQSDGYRYVADTVSALGVPGTSEWYGAMNAAFCVSAVAVSIAGLCSWRLLEKRRRSYLGAVCAYAIGSVLVAAVHAGDGSAHVLGAVLAIGAGNVIAVLVGSSTRNCPRWYSSGSVALGVAGFVASGLLIAGLGPVGAVERASIYSFVGWELLTAGVLLRTSGRRTAAEPAQL